MTIYTIILKQNLFNKKTMCDDIIIEQQIEIMAENEEELWEELYENYDYESAELVGIMPLK